MRVQEAEIWCEEKPRKDAPSKLVKDQSEIETFIVSHCKEPSVDFAGTVFVIMTVKVSFFNKSGWVNAPSNLGENKPRVSEG